MWFQIAAVGNIFSLLQVCEASKVPVTSQQRLINMLFESYEKALRPVQNSTTATNVTLNPGLMSIVDTDEAHESIAIAQSHRMMWKDFYLSWDPDEYEGVKQLLIPMSWIWYPDIVVINMLALDVTLPEDKNYASIDYDGSILVTIPEVVTFHCKYHIHMFPFDVQNCTMRFTSWMYVGDQMNIFYSTPTDLDLYENNTEWHLLSFIARRNVVYYNITGATWVDVYYDFIIQRKPTYYLLTFVLPCVIITTISIVGIFAPFNDSGDREDKVNVGLTTLLTMAVIFTVITEQMPKTSEGMPLLGIYILIQIAISAANAAVAVFFMYQQRKWTIGEPVPRWIMIVKEAVVDIHAPENKHMKQQLTAVNEIKAMLQQLTEHRYDQDTEDRLRKEWQRAGHRLDVIAMIGFLILHFAFTLAFLFVGFSNLQL